jgi:uncharacterized protein (TIGR02246 family)
MIQHDLLVVSIPYTISYRMNFLPPSNCFTSLLILRKCSLIKALALNLLRWLLASIFLVSLMSGMDASASHNRSQQDIRSLIEQAKTAWVARDADALAQLFLPDGELIVPGQRWQGQARIREGISNFSQHYMDVSITIQRIILDGNQAAVEWHYEDTEKATGQRNRVDDVIVIEIKDGRISYWREYFDTKTPLKQQSRE